MEEEVEWGEFLIGGDDGLFAVGYSKRKLNANTLKFGGKHPYVTRKSSNNGIQGYIDYDEQFLNKANTISFGMDTAVMYYQSKPYFTGDKIKVFHPKGKLGRYIALYTIASIQKAFQLFGWGMSYSDDVVNNVKIQLPIDKNGNPHYAYMTAYIRQLEIDRLEEIKRDTTTRLAAMGHVTDVDGYELTDDDHDVLTYQPEWGKFRIGDLFEVRKGKRLPERVLVASDGSIALINQSAKSNMVLRYSGLQGNNEIYKGNAITFAVNTKMLTYQKADFYTIADILFLKSNFLAREIALYICVSIHKQLPKSGWDKIFKLSDMKNLIIELPIASERERERVPNFQYMARYIQGIEKQKLLALLKYATTRLWLHSGLYKSATETSNTRCRQRL